MEEVFEYRVSKPMKPEDIEGLAEIEAAYAARAHYFQAKMEFERGDRDDMPVYNKSEIPDLEAKYPTAAAYNTADIWAHSFDLARARLGARACERILAREDPAKVLDEMQASWNAFKLVQQEG